jgi:hypothetical protein
LKSLPGWLIDKALDQAKAGVRGKLEKYIATKGLPAAQDLALSVLGKVGVKEEDVLRKFGVATRAALDVEKLVIVQGDIKAIQGGEVRPEEVYPPPEGANGAGAQPSAGSTLGSFAAKAASGGDQGQGGATTATGVTSAATGSAGASAGQSRPRRMGAAEVEEARRLAGQLGVSFDEVEGHFGGSLGTLEIEGKDASAVELAVTDYIRSLAGGKKK